MNSIDAYKDTRQKLFDDFGIRPASKIISTQGPIKNVHYLELGAGQPLILVHGGGAHSTQWITILKPLSDHFHLYVVDRPGCGLSDTINYKGVDFKQSAIDFIRTFMDAIGLQHSMFLANSMGAYFSINFAMKYPERVDKLILIGAPAGMNRWIPWMPRLMGTVPLFKLLAKVAKPTIKDVVRPYKATLVADVSKLSDDFLQHELSLGALPGAMDSFFSLFARVLTLRGFKKELYIGDQLGQLKMPVRFIWGDKDAFEKPESGLLKAKAIKDFKFEVVENAGHNPWLDQPEKCSELVVKMAAE